MSLSNTVENEAVQDFLTRHPVLWVGLSTTSPGEDGSGATEPSGGGYVRMLVGDVTIVDNTFTNDDAIVFPQSGADWGTIAYGMLYDDDDAFCGSGGITPTACPPGTTIVIPAGTTLFSQD